MRYRKPFTEDQRQDAIGKYRSLRRNYRHLRDSFPPAGEKERSLYRAYRHWIREFGIELSKPPQRVRPTVLNDLEWQATVVLTEYFAERMKRGGMR